MGAVRAGSGLPVSTHKQDQAQGVHLDASEAKQQIEGGSTMPKHSVKPKISKLIR